MKNNPVMHNAFCWTDSLTSWRQVLGSPGLTPRPKGKATRWDYWQDYSGERQSPVEIPSGKYPNRKGSMPLLYSCCTYTMYIQKSQIPLTLPWLQKSELSWDTKQVPSTTHQLVTPQDKGQKVVYKSRSKEWIQPDKDYSRRRMENTLLY